MQNEIKTFKNANFTKRDYECTNVVACQGSQAPKEGNWVECSESEIAALAHLWTQAGVRFFGYL